MALNPGTRLGPYEIVSPIGSGGMGDVYRATDTRLNRAVAVKVLPPDFALDPERRQRFEREARLVASLSHPHICAIHDVGRLRADGASASQGEEVDFLVMEFLEGETLAERLARGPLPLDQTIRIGAEIASGLAAAHREHVVHRDLKPANVMLTRSHVKLLDFGIAKAVQPVTAADGGMPTKSLTVATAPGAVFGTLPYMSPEQIEGRPVDARSDIFALGAVLYEMATGRRAFAGDTYGSLASSILTSTPPAIAASPALDRIVRTCLEKDPDRRWQSAQDVALQLTMLADRASGDITPARRGSVWMPWAVAAAAVVIAGASWLVDRRAPAGPRPASPGVVAFTVPPPPFPDGFGYSVEGPSLAVSPDGAWIAFVTISRSGDTRVWVRPLDSIEAKPLEGTEGVTSLFWSPDSTSIGFFAGGKLKLLNLAGGAPVPVCNVRRDVGQQGTWGADGTILFASVEGEAIMKVAASGGTAVAIMKPDRSRGQRRITWPMFLPDGKQFTYTAASTDDSGAIMLGREGSASRPLFDARSNTQYVEPGYLVYVQDGDLLARRFDAGAGQVSGGPIAVARPVSYFFSTGLAQFSASRTGVIAYQAHSNLSRIAWFDRSGQDIGTVREPGGYLSLRLSADGRRLLFERGDDRTGAHDIHVLEVDRGTETRLTADLGSEVFPVWASDDTIIYSATAGEPPHLMRRSLASGADERLGPAGVPLQQATDISRDLQWLLYRQRTPRGDFDLHLMHLADKNVQPLRQSDVSENDARFSPDGRYIAFVSNDGGRPNVYVMPFRSPGARRAVTPNGGSLPRWSPDGRELFYIASSTNEAHVMSVPITPTPALEFGKVEQLFPLTPGRRWSDYVPTANGRFLALHHVQFAGTQPVTVIANWRRQN